MQPATRAAPATPKVRFIAATVPTMPPGRKRSLSRSGGKCALSGDPERAAVLAHCLSVDPAAKLRFTHGFHAYPARMHPDTVERAIAVFPGGAVFDPFVGSGTTALEAARAGRPFIGGDISKVAVEIAWARTRAWHPDRIRAMEQAALALAGRAFREPDVPLPEWGKSAREWYDPHTLREIIVLKALIDGEEAEVMRLLTVVLSSIAIKLSRQISDSDPKRDAFHRPRPRHASYRWFREKVSELASSLLQLSSDLHKRKVAWVEPDLRRADARSFRPAAPADLVLTSPPYVGTYDYALHHARRYPLFGEDPSFALKNEIGSRRRPGAYREDLEACLRNMLAALSPAGKILLLVGDGEDLAADALLAELSSKLGARVAAGASQRRREGREHLLLIERA